MASTTTFGATIVPQAGDSNTLPLPPTLDSPALTPAASREDLADAYSASRRVPPHSPFYQHPPDSRERTSFQTTSRIDLPTSSEKDLEAGSSLAPPDDLKPFTSKVSLDCNKECKMWPSKQTLMETRIAEKRKKREGLKRRCGPVIDWWGAKTRRQKLLFKILLGLIVCGVIVAVAVGITVGVNGTVYVSEGHQAQIPGTR